MFNSIKLSSSFGGIQKLFKYLFLFICIVETINDRRTFRRVAWATIFGLALVSLDGIFQFISGRDFIRGYTLGKGFQYLGELGPQRIRGSMHNPNDFASYLITVIPLILSLFLFYLKGKKRILIGLVIIMSFFCMFHTYYRGAGLGFVIIMILFSIIKKDIIPILGLVTIFLFMPLLLSKNTINWTVSHAKPYDFFVEEGGRRLHWQAAINMIKAHPFIGIGVNTFCISYDKYKSRTDPMSGWYAHNSYLQLAGEIGLIGLSIFIIMLVNIIKVWWSSYKRICTLDLQAISLGIFAGFSGYLVAAILESSLQYSNLAVLFWFMVGLMCVKLNSQELLKKGLS